MPLSLLIVTAVPVVSMATESECIERISLVLNGETVEEAVAALAEVAGLTIELSGSVPDDHRINDVLQAVTLSEALTRILGRTNHVLAWNSADSLAVILLHHAEASAADSKAIPLETEAFVEDEPVYSFSDDELVPPDDYGVPVTIVPDQMFESLAEPFDPEDFIPPDEDG